MNGHQCHGDNQSEFHLYYFSDLFDGCAER